MQARISVYGFLKNVVPKRLGQHPFSLEFESTTTVYSILTSLLKIKTLDVIVLVNGKIANVEYVLQDHDDVRIIAPIAGG